MVYKTMQLSPRYTHIHTCEAAARAAAAWPATLDPGIPALITHVGRYPACMFIKGR